MRACWHITVMLMLGLLAAGCAKDRQCCQSSYPPSTVALECQPVERRTLVADLSLLGNRSIAPTTRAYCNLTERDAQCLATMHAPNARLLEQEAEALDVQPTGHWHTAAGGTTASALRLQAVHERNRNASAALQLLLRIAGAEHAADSLRQQLAEIKETLSDLKRLQIAGLDLPLSGPQTEAQHFEVEHKLGELELTIDLLNEQLAMLLGQTLPPGTRYWPDVNLQVNPAKLPSEEIQALAVVQRADLAALRVAASGDRRENANAARALLGQSTAGLGFSGSCSLISLVHFRAAEEEAAIRSEQLYGAAADRERSIRNNVTQAIATIEARLDQIALSRQRTESLRLHLDNLHRKSEASQVPSFEIRRAKLAVFAAEQDLFHDVIEWKVAGVKLREAQGELAVECGYTDALSVFNCCY
jgi:hypothetical protein